MNAGRLSPHIGPAAPLALEYRGRQLVQAMQLRRIADAEGVWLDAEPHIYSRGGVELLGVTEILKNVGLIDERWWAEDHAVRGRLVHTIAARVVNDEPAADGYAGYEQSLRIWQGGEAPITLATELLVSHDQSGYAGTLDWLMVWREAIWVIDFKTGAEAKWHRLQTAGYAEALRSLPDCPPLRRAALYLHADGTPATVRVHYDPADHAYFKAALAVETFKR